MTKTAKEKMKDEVDRLHTILIALSKSATYGMPGARIRKKRQEAEIKYVTALREYERLCKADIT